MKTKLFIASALAATCSLVFAACSNPQSDGSDGSDDTQTQTHTHTFASEWSHDETYHWHAATCEHTNEVSDRAEHTFADGECTVCGYEQPVLLTEDTDFNALTSDTVTQDEWQTAFADSSFTNLTIGVTSVYGDLVNTDQYFKAADGECLYYLEGANGYGIDRDGQRELYISDGGADYIPAHGMMTEEELDYYLSYRVLCPDLGQFYSQFTYNQSTGAYEYDGNGITTNGTLDPQYVMIYRDISVKIVDGKLALVEWGYAEIEGGGISTANIMLTMYDYGTTVIEAPDINQ